MALKKSMPVLHLLWMAAAAFGLHELGFYVFGFNLPENFHFILIDVYAFFLACSIVILFTLIIIKERNIDNVGSTFLLLTCVKMLVGYVFLQQILPPEAQNPGFERGNFFIVFAVFLTIETVLAIRILNNR